jgi:hypothetical protein
MSAHSTFSLSYVSAMLLFVELSPSQSLYTSCLHRFMMQQLMLQN